MPARSPSRAAPRLRLQLQIAAARAGLPSAAQFRRWADAVPRLRGDVTVRVVGGGEARSLNRRFRGLDHATNVLSFPYGAARGSLRGDVVLCAPVIAREARAQGKPLLAHYAHLTLHALLHLQGHDHTGRRDTALMEALEKRLLAKLGYSDPYA
jgi:probable rRNA maturation factor